MKLGMNLSFMTYGNTFVPFQDLRLAAASGWYDTPPGWQGWHRELPPGPAAGAKPPGTFPATEGYVRPGTYTLACKGTGKLAVQSDGLPPGGITCAFDAAKPTTYPIPVKATQGDRVIITVVENDPTDRATGLHDLQFLAPGVQPGLDWHSYWDPAFLASHGQWTGPLRTLDWTLATPPAPGAPVTWADRTKAPQCGIEGLVDLSNRTGRDLWLVLPAQCLSPSGLTDFPAQLGTYLAKYADPSITVYVEFGDEIGWNWTGWWAGETAWCNSVAPTLPDPATGAPYNPKAGWGLAVAYATHYATEAIRAQVDPTYGPTVKSVLSGQCTWYGNSIAAPLGWMGKHGWKPDAIACAPYASYPNGGPYTVAAVAALVAAGNVDGAVDLILAGIQSYLTSTILPCCHQWRVNADALGVPLYFYEFALDDNGMWGKATTAPACHALAGDPRAAAFTASYLEQLSAYGAMGCYFGDCYRGAWGSRQYADDPSPIRQALATYAVANP